LREPSRPDAATSFLLLEAFLLLLSVEGGKGCWPLSQATPESGCLFSTQLVIQPQNNKVEHRDCIRHVRHQKILSFTHTEFAPPFMGYLYGLGKMERRERESIKHGCSAHRLGYWERS